MEKNKKEVLGYLKARVTIAKVALARIIVAPFEKFEDEYSRNLNGEDDE